MFPIPSGSTPISSYAMKISEITGYVQVSIFDLAPTSRSHRDGSSAIAVPSSTFERNTQATRVPVQFIHFMHAWNTYGTTATTVGKLRSDQTRPSHGSTGPVSNSGMQRATRLSRRARRWPSTDRPLRSVALTPFCPHSLLSSNILHKETAWLSRTSAVQDIRHNWWPMTVLGLSNNYIVYAINYWNS